VASSSTASASRRREQGARTRDRVLEVATDLMARRGYSGTTISAICKAAGVMPASIYWHFDSKEGLLAAVIERAADAWFRGALHALAEADASGDEDQPRVAGLRYVFQEQPEFYRVLLLISLERREVDDASLEAVKRIRERCKRLLAQRIDRRLAADVDNTQARREMCARLAALAMALLDGFFVAHQIDQPDPRQTALRFEQFAWTMTLARSALQGQADAAGRGERIDESG
jgi:AcrR family transcriptional regulator